MSDESHQTVITVPKKQRKPKKLPDDIIIIDDLVIDDLVIDDLVIDDLILATEPSKKLQTEDLGKKFEMGICLLYDIPYDGKYKYSMEEAEKLRDRLSLLTGEFPHKLKHTAKNGSQYDFTGAEDESIKLSAKTTKKDGKVCPQVIGQPSKKKFCEFFSVDINFTLQQIKAHIEQNVKSMMDIYFDLTFDCPVLYYNQKSDKLQLIKVTKLTKPTKLTKLTKNIDWFDQVIEFSHNKKNKEWGESSSISISNITIGEFQVHNHRDCIKFRWSFENLLEKFPESFEIVNL